MQTSGEMDLQIMRDAIGSEPVKKPKRKGVWLILCFMVLVVVGASWVLMNREYLYDWYRGMSYEPSKEMMSIRDSLGLTDKGKFAFNAAKPKLSQREEFNEQCRTVFDEETAVLGCYKDRDIYVYDIQSEELDGIRELTTAHELLHAVWARMSETEKNELRHDLNKVYDDNREYLGEELDTYDINERQEELYVRAGTEVADLPESLEKHFAEIFINQDRIVQFYDSYIVVFREIKAEINDLKKKMEEIDVSISTKSDTYEQIFEQYEEKVQSFNMCAETMGCFESEDEFYTKRNALIAEQADLDGLYVEINQLVDEYNSLVDQYNSDVIRGEELNRTINSMDRVEKLE